MLNFTVGPVTASESIRMIGAEQIPYFRTAEFSSVMLENEQLMKKFVKAGEGSRAVFITGSGTAAMEAAIANSLTLDSKALVINGGSFGQRFVELCNIYQIPFSEIRLDVGKALTQEHLEVFDGKGYTEFIVNIHETSTGVFYDLNLISKFCKRNNLFLIVDAISSFLADPIDMDACGIDMLITGSQKALFCPPGISMIVMSSGAVERVERNDVKCMYLNLKSALKNGERGQTPFTPAVGILRQINARLREIDENGGAEAETARIAELAADFRDKIKGLPFQIISESLSNAVTPLHSLTVPAYDIFVKLKDEYGIWVCPNGGHLAEKVFRVGHIGALTKEDNSTLIAAFNDLHEKNFI